MWNWIDVDLDAYTKERKAKIRGVEVELLVSPYDIPVAVRGCFDKSKNRFIIEFKYLVPEKTKTLTLDQFVTYRIGESSQRLYALEVDVQWLREKAGELEAGLSKEIDEALDKLAQKPRSSLREDNYRLAKDAVLAKQSELFKFA
jgi:hypothetical protein